MAKKLKFSSIFKKRETGAASWQWPSCTHSKTLSFRGNDNIFKTINSIYFDPCDRVETSESWFTNSSESASFSTESEECLGGDQPLEMIIKGVKSERLFFEPGDTSSILEESKQEDLPYKESIVVAMESEDPYLDFKKSMKEMVESEGIEDWEGLQELLVWYLKKNGKVNHGFVVSAFVDLLIEHASTPTCNFSSASSSSFSCPSSPLKSHKEHGEVP